MTNTSLDEYAPSHTPVARPHDAADDSGRDVDHRRTPGAFGKHDDGFILDHAAVDEIANHPKWVPGAVHHPEDVVAKPAARGDDEEPVPNEAAPSQDEPSAPATVEHDTKRGGFARRMLARVDQRLRSNVAVQIVVGTVVEVQRYSADRLEAWLEQGEHHPLDDA